MICLKWKKTDKEKVKYTPTASQKKLWIANQIYGEHLYCQRFSFQINEKISEKVLAEKLSSIIKGIDLLHTQMMIKDDDLIACSFITDPVFCDVDLSENGVDIWGHVFFQEDMLEDESKIRVVVDDSEKFPRIYVKVSHYLFDGVSISGFVSICNNNTIYNSTNCFIKRIPEHEPSDVFLPKDIYDIWLTKIDYMKSREYIRPYVAQPVLKEQFCSHLFEVPLQKSKLMNDSLTYKCLPLSLIIYTLKRILLRTMGFDPEIVLPLSRRGIYRGHDIIGPVLGSTIYTKPIGTENKATILKKINQTILDEISNQKFSVEVLEEYFNIKLPENSQAFVMINLLSMDDMVYRIDFPEDENSKYGLVVYIYITEELLKTYICFNKDYFKNSVINEIGSCICEKDSNHV